MKDIETRKVRFHVSTNRVGSEISEILDIEIPAGSSEEEIELIISDNFEVWMANETDAGWELIEEGEAT